jgi:site-specific DNA-methyltransferase (adenine-specific)
MSRVPLPALARVEGGFLTFEEPAPADQVLTGDCLAVLPTLPAGSVDLVLTDPPYLVRYRDRRGRTIANDDQGDWLRPAFAEIHRVLREDAYAVSFYGWQATDQFMSAWKAAGFRVVGHVVFTKDYPSSVGAMGRCHESAYVLAKGRPRQPPSPIGDVLPFVYTGNRHHPTEKPALSLLPLITAFSAEGELVLDPFCGSGSTLVAAKAVRRRYLGIELDPVHADTARRRLGRSP